MNKLMVLAGAAVFATGAQAVVPGIEFTASVGMTPSNSIDTGVLAKDTDNEFDMTDYDAEVDNGTYIRAQLKLPVIPDITIKHETLVITGEGTESFEFLGEQIDLSGDYELDLTHTDIALTYGIGADGSGVDFGVNTRLFTGDFTAQVEGEEIKESINLAVPMAYLGAKVKIPTTEFTLSGEISTLPAGESSITDWTVKGTWYAFTMPAAAFGVEAGYSSMSMDIGKTVLSLDTEDFQSELVVNRVFVGATMKFD